MKRSPIQAFTSAVVASGNLLIREANRLFKPLGLTVPQFDVLELLSQAPAGLRQNELAGALVVDPSTATYLIDILEKRRWVRRTEDPTDRRAYRVVLTTQGKDLHGKALQPYLSALAHLQRGLDPKALESATALLGKLKPLAREATDQARK